MKYINIVVGIILLLVFFAPIYYTTGHCCGHAYDESMTIIKHFVLGQDSCLVFGNESAYNNVLYFMAIIASLIMFITGVSSEEQKETKK